MLKKAALCSKITAPPRNRQFDTRSLSVYVCGPIPVTQKKKKSGTAKGTPEWTVETSDSDEFEIENDTSSSDEEDFSDAPCFSTESKRHQITIDLVSDEDE